MDASQLPIGVALLKVVATAVHMTIPGAYILRLLARERYGEPPKIVNAVFFELRPLYLPAVLTANAIDLATGEWTMDMGAHPIGLAISLACWWMLRKEDDDRWKRRREKLAEKV